MLDVEDWAEIRRLHRAEGMPIKEIARVMGVSRNTVRAAMASDGPPQYERPPGGVDRGRGRAADPGAAAGVSDDAGDGDRRADRLGPVDPGAERPGGGAAAGVPAAGSGVPDERMRPGEIAQCDFWFPPITLPVGFGQARTADAAAGADDGDRVLAVPGIAVLIPSRHAEDLFAGWWQLIEASARCRGCWCGTGGRDRPVAGRQAGADRATARRSAAPWARR